LKSLRMAVAFLTVLPVSLGGTVVSMSSARAYFPLVGLGLGGILAGLDLAAREVLSPMVVGALLVIALVVLTRAIHIEGFLDACDGLFGGFTRERRLEILHDSHVGAFAVVGGASLLLLKWSLLTELPAGERICLLVLFPCLSRMGMLATMAAFPYAREQGMGTVFQNGRSWLQVGFGLTTAVVASVLLIGGAGGVLLAGALVVSLMFGRWVTGLLGGMTGDTYGAVNEVVEVTVLLFAIILFDVAAELFQSPLA
jgi:adenosylcobinamide-GDP ribazoletransferase